MNTISKRMFIQTMVLAASAIAALPVMAGGDVAAGKALYEGKGACTTCHGNKGEGDGPAAAALNPKPANFAKGDFRLDTDGDGKPGTDMDLANVIRQGAGKYGGNPAMPAHADLSEAEVADLIAYVRSLKQ